MRNFMGLAVLALAGCGGGAGVYLDTDVCEVSGFKRESAKEMQMSGGLMQTGTLEYSGWDDLQDSFNDYVASMKAQGWTIANVDVQSQKAVGTLRKDNRTCSIEFVKGDRGIRATIRVGTTK